VADVVLHIHGGGYTVFSSAFQDPLLAHITVGIIAFTSFRSRDLVSCDSTSPD